MAPDRRTALLARLEGWTEGPLTILAVLWVPLLLAPYLFTLSPELESNLLVVDYVIWAVFAADLIAKVIIARDRLDYVRRHWLDVLLVAVPILRPLRALRAMRLLWAIGASARILDGSRRLMTRRGTGFVLIGAGIVVILAAGLIVAVERDEPTASITSFGDGIWWAITTATTVGYGDKYPLTAAGRGTAVALMLLGIAAFGLVTANLAALFVEEQDDAALAELRQINERLVRIETLQESHRMLESPIPGHSSLQGTAAAPNESEAANIDLDDGLGDWRIHAITRLTKDLPDRGPGKRAKSAGSVVAVIREMQPSMGDRYSYVEFSSVALALSIALAADKRASELRTHVTPEKFETEMGSYFTIPDENLSGFYDFIEQSMISVLFSYQALEAFSNLTIQEKLGDAGTYTLTRTPAKVKQKVAWTAPDVERKCSTEEKITEIVPTLLEMSFNKGNRVGQGFAKLKTVRDDVTHLKYRDQRGAAMAYYAGDSSSVYFRMVNGDYAEISRTAVIVLDFFTKPTGTPRWLRFPLSVYGMHPTEVPGTTRLTITDP